MRANTVITDITFSAAVVVYSLHINTFNVVLTSILLNLSATNNLTSSP
jgi:hypothetical protein